MIEAANTSETPVNQIMWHNNPRHSSSIYIFSFLLTPRLYTTQTYALL
jgi:hypothetical protein